MKNKTKWLFVNCKFEQSSVKAQPHGTIIIVSVNHWLLVTPSVIIPSIDALSEFPWQQTYHNIFGVFALGKGGGGLS